MRYFEKISVELVPLDKGRGSKYSALEKKPDQKYKSKKRTACKSAGLLTGVKKVFKPKIGLTAGIENPQLLTPVLKISDTIKL